MDFRAFYDEKITAHYWLLRDLWQAIIMNYGAKRGLTPNPNNFQVLLLKS
jgi:hypothetical protein